MNSIDVQLEPDDYVSAQMLHTRWTWRRHGTFVMAGLIGAGAIALFGIDNPWTFIGGCALLGGALGGLFCAIVIRQLWLPRRTRRLFAQQKNLQRPVHFEWDDEGLTWKSERGEGTTPWEDYVKARDNERIVLLYHSDAMFQMLPKRAFASESEAQSLLAQVRRAPAAPSPRAENAGT